MQDRNSEAYWPEDGYIYLDCIPPWENIPKDYETVETDETAKNTVKEIKICVTLKM